MDCSDVPPISECDSLGYDTRVEHWGVARNFITDDQIDRRQEFNCNGTLKNWRLRTSEQVSYDMKIWRPVSGVDKAYELVGSQTVHVPTGGLHTVPSSLKFQEGDVLGWKVVANSGLGRLSRRAEAAGDESVCNFNSRPPTLVDWASLCTLSRRALPSLTLSESTY